MEKIDFFAKFKRPIDYLKEDPYKALTKIWDEISLDYLRKELEYMFYMAVSAEVCVYVDQDERKNFVEFYYDLLYFTEAMYFLQFDFSEKKRIWNSIFFPKEKEIRSLVAKPTKLTYMEAKNPAPVIEAFCNKYPLDYCQIELSHFCAAVISYKGRFSNIIFIANLINFYEDLKCLCEAAQIIVSIRVL